MGAHFSVSRWSEGASCRPGKVWLRSCIGIPCAFLESPWNRRELFSSSKHTLSDTHSSLTAVSASKTVVVEEWLKKGFKEDVLITFVSSHNMIIIWLIMSIFWIQYVMITLPIDMELWNLNIIWIHYNMAKKILYSYLDSLNDGLNIFHNTVVFITS